MIDDTNIESLPKAEPPKVKPAPIKLPSQNGPNDTSNWENRTFTTPSGRLVVETEQPKKGDVNVAE